jgi:ankyrin repeat protein
VVSHSRQSHFFWEIAEDLLQHFQNEGRVLGKSLYLFPIKRPFSHWIAHGQAYLPAIDKTVQACQKYHILGFDADGSTDLMNCVNAAHTEADFRLIEAILGVSSNLVVKQRNDDGFSALIYAISMAKHNNKWLRIVKNLADFYSIEELEQIAMFTGSYLHLAVTNNSVLGARILLERGVNVNQPTFDEYQSTPLQLCMYISGSTSMFSMLLEFGADLNMRDALTGATPFQTRLMGLQHDFDLLDMASNQILSEPMDGETLHAMLSCSMGLKTMHRTDAREAFRYLLASKNIDKYIDEADERGVTLIQRAAYHLHIDSVRLLLEAGADASIPLDTGAAEVVPLQIACSVGRLFWMSHASGASPNLCEKREMAMGVATELLHWHQARGDEQFSRISELHLAACMTNPIDVQKCLANGYDPEAKGRWPSIAREVTPKELMEADLESEIEALESLRPQVSEDSGASQDPLRIPLAFEAIAISAIRDQIRVSLMSSQDSSRKVQAI